MLQLVAVVIVGFGAWYVIRNSRKSKDDDKSESVQVSVPLRWRAVLAEKVAFYNSLSEEEKLRFEFKIQQFFSNHKITGVQVEIDIVDRLLVAASASILTFEFPNWEYSELDEVLIYPNAFNSNFETAGPDRTILGMVGTGYMDGKMILSKQALHHGFSNTSDKKNVAIHEFVHLIDKEDGVIDGIPSILLENQYSIPWMDLVKQKINHIHQDDSDINPYGGTNDQEFFAVATEYFFERPQLMKKKHPKLHALLVEIFEQDLTKRDFSRTLKEVGRNDPCPCGSGEKYKRCCLE